MSPLVPLLAAALAAALLYGRHRRLAAGRSPVCRDDPRPRALAEAAASAVPVLLIGLIPAAATSPHLVPPTRIVFTLLAVAVCLTQFRRSMAISQPF